MGRWLDVTLTLSVANSVLPGFRRETINHNKAHRMLCKLLKGREIDKFRVLGSRMNLGKIVD